MRVRNVDEQVVEGFGREWSTFDQRGLSDRDRWELFSQYFSVFPWETLPEHAVGTDVGCGSGRWAMLVAPRVGQLHCVDASAAALGVARANLSELANVELHLAAVDALPFPDGTMDFAYSLGVLHHVPDTLAALRSCAAVLKPGAPFLVYLYYAFDNRPAWYRALWRMSDLVRRTLSRSPYPLRLAVSGVIAAVVYWPLARLARLAELLGRDVGAFPLAYYRRRRFYVMRTDALDRFGTRLERRFTRTEIDLLLREAGFVDVRFSDDVPYWTACAVRAAG